MKLATLDGLPEFFDKLIKRCAQKDRRQRGTFTDIIKDFENNQDPIQLSNEKWKELKEKWREDALRGIGCEEE